MTEYDVIRGSVSEGVGSEKSRDYEGVRSTSLRVQCQRE